MTLTPDTVIDLLEAFDRAPNREGLNALREARLTLARGGVSRSPEVLLIKAIAEHTPLRWLEPTDEERALAENPSLAPLILPPQDAPFPEPSLEEADLRFWLSPPPFFAARGAAVAYAAWLERFVALCADAVEAVEGEEARRERAQCVLKHLYPLPAIAGGQPIGGLFRQRARLVRQAMGPLQDIPASAARHGPVRVLLLVDCLDGGERHTVAGACNALAAERFDVILYTLGEVPKDTLVFAEKLRAEAKRAPEGGSSEILRDIAALAPEAVILGSNIGIHYTRYERIAAHVLAPLQVNLVTSPWTVGLPSVTHILFGEGSFVHGATDSFDEEVVAPTGFHGFHMDAPTGDPYPNEAAAGEESDPFTFFAAAPLLKITREALETWARILADCPGSRLILACRRWLTHGEAGLAALQDTLSPILAERGVSQERVELPLPFPERETLLTAMARSQVILDCFPQGAGSSVVDPYLAGRPLVTMVGAAPYCNEGAAVAEAYGLGETVARSEAAYAEIARRLWREEDFRKRMTERVRNVREAEDFFDNRAFSRAFADWMEKAVLSSR